MAVVSQCWAKQHPCQDFGLRQWCSNSYWLVPLWFVASLAGVLTGGLNGGHLPGDRVDSGSVHIMLEQGGMIMPGEFGDIDDMMHEFGANMGKSHKKTTPAAPASPSPSDETFTN